MRSQRARHRRRPEDRLFAGSDEGAATIYSLVCTCGLLGVEPWACLKEVLQRIAEGTDPASLTPRLWKATRATD